MLGKVVGAIVGAKIDGRSGRGAVKGALKGALIGSMIRRAGPLGMVIAGGMAARRLYGMAKRNRG